MELIDALENFRLLKGWSQSKMARELGSHSSNYSEFIHGKRDLSLACIKRAYALGISAEVLLSRDHV